MCEDDLQYIGVGQVLARSAPKVGDSSQNFSNIGGARQNLATTNITLKKFYGARIAYVGAVGDSLLLLDTLILFD